MMDELVADLSSALDRTNDPLSAHSDTTVGTRESPSGTPTRRTSSKKRRSRKRRSDYLPQRERPKASTESNDSVEEALMDYIENIKCQSDSDPEELENSAFAKRSFRNSLRDNLDPYPIPERDKAESDSVCEAQLIGLTKRRKKRKRKIKRSLNDRDSPLTLVNLKSVSRTRKRKVCGKSATGSEIHSSLRRRDEEGSLADIENGLSSGCGEPMETNATTNHFYKLPSRLHFIPKEHTGNVVESAAPRWPRYDNCKEKMATVRQGGFEIDHSSSDESDLDGIFTNDEGRLGDDEKEESSFECDVKVFSWWEEKTTSDIEEEKFQNIVNGTMDAYRGPFASGVDGKSYQGFQGRLKKNKSAFGLDFTLGETNRNIAVFLQNDKWTELSVHPSNKLEKAQVYQWASLYSLHCQADPNHRGRMLLRKIGLSSPSRPKKGPRGESKRPRRNAPQLDNSHSSVGAEANPIPSSNIGNQMLRGMGWTPGTGLGTDRNGIKDPVCAFMRPKGLGLGHPWPS